MNNQNKTFHKIARLVLLPLIIMTLVAKLIYSEVELGGQTGGRLLVILIGLYLLAELIWLYTDYQHHRRPLVAVDPDVDYTFTHHISQVTIPTMRYRLLSTFHKG